MFSIYESLRKHRKNILWISPPPTASSSSPRLHPPCFGTVIDGWPVAALRPAEPCWPLTATWLRVDTNMQLSAVAARCVRGLYCLPVSAALRHCLGEVVCFPLRLASPAIGSDQSGVRKASAAGGNGLNFEDTSAPLAWRSCDAAAALRPSPPSSAGCRIC